jgi:hypothetical protein
MVRPPFHPQHVERRRLALFCGSMLFCLAGPALAQGGAREANQTVEPAALPVTVPQSQPAVPAAPDAPGAAKGRVQLGFAFLPMLFGDLLASPNEYSRSSLREWAPLSPAYGVGLSLGYNVVAGLILGVAPQAIFHIDNKDGSADKVDAEYDLMARVAYVLSVMPGVAAYLEVLPGYSFVSLTSNVTYWSIKPTTPKGLVLAANAGATFDFTDQVFVSFGIGYQLGFQKMSVMEYDLDMRTRFLRIALGGGKRF